MTAPRPRGGPIREQLEKLDHARDVWYPGCACGKRPRCRYCGTCVSCGWCRACYTHEVHGSLQFTGAKDISLPGAG